MIEIGTETVIEIGTEIAIVIETEIAIGIAVDRDPVLLDVIQETDIERKEIGDEVEARVAVARALFLHYLVE